jgi:hypothetical protein
MEIYQTELTISSKRLLTASPKKTNKTRTTTATKTIAIAYSISPWPLSVGEKSMTNSSRNTLENALRAARIFST